MKEQFERELRYVVFKIKDVHIYLNDEQIDTLQTITETISAGRVIDGKSLFNAVVVEQDWPEYELVWEMIESRVIGGGNDARRIVACVNACVRIPTGQLEEMQHFEAYWKLPARVALAERQRDELVAALKEIRLSTSTQHWKSVQIANTTLAKVGADKTGEGS